MSHAALFFLFYSNASKRVSSLLEEEFLPNQSEESATVLIETRRLHEVVLD
jgi:hypothetical protein